MLLRYNASYRASYREEGDPVEEPEAKAEPVVAPAPEVKSEPVAVEPAKEEAAEKQKKSK